MDSKVGLAHFFLLHCLCDGDTKSYQEVIKSKPYGELPIDKAECVGHVRKRVGTRLRDLKIKYRGIKLKDGKCIGGGEGRLNDKTINTLQNYQGMAIPDEEICCSRSASLLGSKIHG